MDDLFENRNILKFSSTGLGFLLNRVSLGIIPDWGWRCLLPRTPISCIVIMGMSISSIIVRLPRQWEPNFMRRSYGLCRFLIDLLFNLCAYEAGFFIWGFIDTSLYAVARGVLKQNGCFGGLGNAYLTMLMSRPGAAVFSNFLACGILLGVLQFTSNWTRDHVDDAHAAHVRGRDGDGDHRQQERQPPERQPQQRQPPERQPQQRQPPERQPQQRQPPQPKTLRSGRTY